jgi:hypothetical protein
MTSTELEGHEGKSLGYLLTGAHLSKTTKGAAASFAVVQA